MRERQLCVVNVKGRALASGESSGIDLGDEVLVFVRSVQAGSMTATAIRLSVCSESPRTLKTVDQCWRKPQLGTVLILVRRVTPSSDHAV